MILTSRTNSFQIVKEMASTGSLISVRLGLNLRLEKLRPVVEIDYVVKFNGSSLYRSGYDSYKINSLLQ